MHNRKPFLNGLGIGLIAGAILLSLMNTAVQTDKLWDAQTVKKQAELNGLQVFDKKEKLYSQAEMDKAVAAAQPSPSPIPSASAAAPAAGAKPGEPVRIYISEGYNSTDVAKLLAAAGIISDAEAFLNRVEEQNLEAKINRGLFSLKPDESVDDVLQQITVKHSP